MPPRPANICTIGSAQHGKTTLTRALLAKLNSAAPETKQLGAFRSNHYTFETSCRTYHHFDPSADHVPKSLATSEFDGAILVVSAQDGVTGSVEKHVELARFFDVGVVLPFLSKCDLVADAHSKGDRARDVVKLLRDYGYRIFEPAIVLGTCRGSIGDGSHERAITQLIELMDREIRSRYD
jgi:elongation factor Tu